MFVCVRTVLVCLMVVYLNIFVDLISSCMLCECASPPSLAPVPLHPWSTSGSCKCTSLLESKATYHVLYSTHANFLSMKISSIHTESVASLIVAGFLQACSLSPARVSNSGPHCFVGERQRKRSKVLVTSSNHHELTEQRFLLTLANYDN